MRLIRGMVIVALLLATGGRCLWLFAQETGRPVFRVKVDMVVLSFTITDS